MVLRQVKATLDMVSIDYIISQNTEKKFIAFIQYLHIFSILKKFRAWPSSSIVNKTSCITVSHVIRSAKFNKVSTKSCYVLLVLLTIPVLNLQISLVLGPRLKCSYIFSIQMFYLNNFYKPISVIVVFFYFKSEFKRENVTYFGMSFI